MGEQVEKLPIDTICPPQIVTININPSGLTVTLKLTRDNFILWRTQILPVLAAYDVMDHIDQDLPEMSILYQEGQSITNPAYKVWFKTDKVVLAEETKSYGH